MVKISNFSTMNENLQGAVNFLRNGEVIAFPTETVYGLGANALDGEAVKKIFLAKGRPSDNPIITHISSLEMFSKVVSESFDKRLVEKLQDRFWPGPLTLILPKADIVPYSTTGNLETIAVRMPNHPIALELIKESNLPIAAPSANISGKPSPTTAQDVFDDLQGKIPLIIDGGPTEIGLESTVLDISNPQLSPVILRPGKVTKEELEQCLKMSVDIYDPNVKSIDSESLIPKSPGMKYRHYAPNAELEIVDNLNTFKSVLMKSKSENKRIGLIIESHFEKLLLKEKMSLDECIMYVYKDDEELASKLYFKLREMDRQKRDVIITYFKESEGFGKAILNRLNKASTKK